MSNKAAEKANKYIFPNVIASAIAARWGLKKKRPTKPNTAKRIKLNNTEPGISNRKICSQTSLQERNCKTKSKINKRKIDSGICKNFSFSLSQPELLGNTSSSRQVLRNWQPPLKVLRYEQNTENEENSSQQGTSSADMGFSKENNGNEETVMQNTGIISERVDTKTKTTICNANSQDGDKSLSQQSTQDYVPRENEERKTEPEKCKCESENIEILSTGQDTGKQQPKSKSNSHPETLTSDTNHIDRKDCIAEDEIDQCFVPEKRTHHNNQLVTKEDKDEKQDTEVMAGEESGQNTMNKSDIPIISSGTNSPTKRHNFSDCKENPKTEPSYDPVICQIQNLTIKTPIISVSNKTSAKYVCSVRTLIGSEEESPLPLDLVLGGTFSQSLINWDAAGEMEQPVKVEEIPMGIFHKSTEQISRIDKCEGNGSTSGQILTQIESNKSEIDANNQSPTAAVKNFGNLGNGPITESKEPTNMLDSSSLLPFEDLPIHRTAVQFDKIIKPVALSDTNLKDKSDSPRTSALIHNLKIGVTKCAPTSEANSEENKNPSESLMAENICHLTKSLTERWKEDSDSLSAKNEKDRPEVDFIEKDSKHRIEYTGDGVKYCSIIGYTDPSSLVYSSNGMTNEFLPEENKIILPEASFNKFKDISCKSPAMAAEAPNICKIGKGGEDHLTNQSMPDTTGHGYLLDDDIGLTGSQLLRIEDECQYNTQSRKEMSNHPKAVASGYGEARIPDVAFPAPELPLADWAQTVQEKRQKLRRVIREISRLNALLTRVRKETWPLPQSTTPSGGISKSGTRQGPLRGAAGNTGPRWGPNVSNL